jgi:hypothetical protein
MTVGLIVFVLYLYYFVGINDLVYAFERLGQKPLFKEVKVAEALDYVLKVVKADE